MRRAQGLQWGCALLLVAALTGCREGPPASNVDYPTEFSTTPPATTAPQTSRGVFEAWIRKALRANTGRFTVQFPAGGNVVRDEGTYQVAPRVSTFTRIIFNTSGQLVTLRVFANRRDAWLRASSGPLDYGQCWAVDPGSLAAQYGLDLGEAGSAEHPAVRALGMAQIDGYSPAGDELEATTSLYAVMSILGGALTAQLGIPPATEATTPIYIQLNGNEVVGWSTSFRALLMAADKAGFRSPLVDPQAFPSSSIVVTIKANGMRLEQKQPRPGRVVELVSDPLAFAASLKDCVRR